MKSSTIQLSHDVQLHLVRLQVCFFLSVPQTSSCPQSYCHVFKFSTFLGSIAPCPLSQHGHGCPETVRLEGEAQPNLVFAGRPAGLDCRRHSKTFSSLFRTVWVSKKDNPSRPQRPGLSCSYLLLNETVWSNNLISVPMTAWPIKALFLPSHLP